MVGKKKTNNAPSNSPEDNLANLQLRGGASVQSSTLPRLNRNNIVSAFNDYFGNATKLENWQRLCRDIGVDDELPSITKCKQVIFKVSLRDHKLQVTHLFEGTGPCLGQHSRLGLRSAQQHYSASSLPIRARTCCVHQKEQTILPKAEGKGRWTSQGLAGTYLLRF